MESKKQLSKIGISIREIVRAIFPVKQEMRKCTEHEINGNIFV